jgi:hypothetical protein
MEKEWLGFKMKSPQQIKSEVEKEKKIKKTNEEKMEILQQQLNEIYIRIHNLEVRANNIIYNIKLLGELK